MCMCDVMLKEVYLLSVYSSFDSQICKSASVHLKINVKIRLYNKYKNKTKPIQVLCSLQTNFINIEVFLNHIFLFTLNCESSVVNHYFCKEIKQVVLLKYMFQD